MRITGILVVAAGLALTCSCGAPAPGTGPRPTGHGSGLTDAAWEGLRATQPRPLAAAARAGTWLRELHDSGAGPIVARFGQHLDGIEVFGAARNVALGRDLQPLFATGALLPALRPRSRAFGADARAAVARAHAEMTGTALPAAAVVRGAQREGDYQDLAVPRGSARARRAWFPRAGALWPAWYLELSVGKPGETGSAIHSFVIAAEDPGAAGAVLFRHDMVVADSFSYRVWADKDGRFTPWDSPQGNDFTPHPTGTRDGSAPDLKAQSVVSLQNVPFSKNDPWLAADATEARGNNVWAYADVAAPDGFGAGDIAVPTTGARAFDRSYDPKDRPNGGPEAIRAVTTNLFYIANYMHDTFYDAGFDEKAGNPQQDNYGRGGIAGDPLHAEAQDFEGLNNANAAAMSDGASPRIQMFLWTTTLGRQLAVDSPMDLAGNYPLATAAFGPDTFDLTLDAVVVDDGVMTPSDGCESPFANAAAVAGKIALIDRGTCSFVTKVGNAQANGASAVVIVNNAPGLPPDPLGGMAPMPIGIPTLGMAKEDGDKVKARLMGGAVRMTLRSNPLDRDGALDATIASHEWGHVLSGRLVGNGNGLTSLQAGGMGEGWSDFVALLTIVRPEDAMVAANAGWKGTYAIGSHVLAQPNAFYDGIRRYPYSTDKSKDPLTFKHIQKGVALPDTPAPAFGADGAYNHEVHATGEVWATMLWECFTALLKDGRYPFDQAVARMRGYLVAGLKLTPHAPTILEARDALLAAAYAGEPKDAALFWQAFARRGAGSGAAGPDRDSPDNTPVTESFVVGNDLGFEEASLDDSVKSCDHDGVLDNGEVGLLTVKIRNTGAGVLAGTTVAVKADSAAVSFPEGAKAKFPKIEPYQSGTATVKVALDGAQPQLKFGFALELTDPELAVPRTLRAAVKVQANYDDVPESSATDTVDARSTPWSVSGDTMLDGTQKWHRVFDGPDGRWRLDGNETISDQYLVSPPLEAAPDGGLTMRFKHRFRFEIGMGQYADGGVVELSTDDGRTWQDIGARATAGGYGGMIYKDNPPLSGRRAFVGTSAGYPAGYQDTVLDLGADYRGRTVRVRFRMGTDEGTASAGWEVDEIAFSGLRNKPFSLRSDNRLMCDRRPPVADAGPDQTVAPGAVVTLQGSGTDPAGERLRFRWTQGGGPTVQLSDPATAQPTFVAPDAMELTEVPFTLVVGDSKLESAPASVKITVDPSLKPRPPEDRGGGCGCRAAGRTPSTVPGLAAAVLLLLGRARRRRPR